MLSRKLELFSKCQFLISCRFGVNDFTQRTRTCGELRREHEGEKVTLFGWLAYKRFNQFIVLRDAYGSVQGRISEENTKLLERLKLVNRESVLKVDGVVASRGDNYRNPRMRTGDIEVVVDSIQLLNGAPGAHPFYDQEPTDLTRLKYRYIDLRTPYLQGALRMRAQIVHKMRKYLHEEAGFIEVETPTLFRSTPGGAHEFIVPAPKPNIGKFYSLPQSPQQFKQLLMCGGIDRYYQIARCYRDEGAKQDRQPEFTQVDVELSFTDQDSVLKLIESVIYNSWPDELVSLRPPIPFRRLRYAKAKRLYGTDKPDLRIPWLIGECSEELAFLNTNASPRFVARLFVAVDAARLVMQKNFSEWQRIINANARAQNFEIVTEKKKSRFKELDASVLIDKFGVKPTDALIISWGDDDGDVNWTLGQMRNLIAESIGLRAEQRMEFVWITHYPLFVIDAQGRLASTHHPFTAPMPEDESLLHQPDNLFKITGQHYDLVLNGVELGGGSIRIHDANLQRYVLSNLLEISINELSHLIEALTYGAPPHGGFAIGLDRFIALMVGRGNSSVPIRDVIAFPKSKDGRDVMTKSPMEINEERLKRYGIRLDEAAKNKEEEVTMNVS